MAWFEAASTWTSQQLATSTGVSTYALLLLGGVLASLLPCVYPLYPITAGILRARYSKLGRFAHPVVYYFGLVTIYFAFGIIASVTGGRFNEVLRLGATNLIIGGVLLLLALATAGWLQFPVWGPQDRARDGFVGTLLMGAGAGLLSSACVGPVVVSILLAMAAGSTEVSITVALTAASKMMVFGMGVGLPLVAIGVFGVALPASGPWMVRIQQLLAVLIAWFGVGYVLKGLSGVGFDPTASYTLLTGVALVGGATFLAQDATQRVEERAKRAVLAVAFVVGFFVVGRSVLSGPSTSTAFARGSAALPEMEQNGNLTWYLDKDAAYAAAAKSGQPVFVDFHGDWCTNCAAFQDRALSDAQLNGALQRSVLLKVRDTTALFERYRNDPRFPELKVGLPFFVITNAGGELLYKTSDYTKSDEMVLFLPSPSPP